MSIEIKDLITLSDKNEYVVVSKIEYNNETYYYIADIKNPSNLKFCYLDNNELVEVSDSNLILSLLPLFKETISI